jgi:hypothetical protein
MENFDDDDCPPPLEDMSNHLNAIKSIKENQTNQVTKSKTKEVDEEEEVRLAPKKVV